MTKLATLIELGHQHGLALERAGAQIHPDVRQEHRSRAKRELQDAVAGHALPLAEIRHLLMAVGGMLARYADRTMLTADAEGELAAADELLDEAAHAIDVAIEHEAAAEAARHEQMPWAAGYDAYAHGRAA